MIFLFVSREHCNLQITGKSEWGKVSTWPGSKQTTQEVGTVEVLHDLTWYEHRYDIDLWYECMCAV